VRGRSIAPWLAVGSAKAGCAKHNLEKSDKILTIIQWIFADATAAPHIQGTVRIKLIA